MTRRREVTERIAQLLPPGPDRDVDYALRHWYRNIRSTGGFRLTEHGYQCLLQAQCQSWQVDINLRDLTRPAVLDLDRVMRWPYYIDLRRRLLVMFGSSEAMMITLIGDVKDYLRRRSPAPEPGKSQ